MRRFVFLLLIVLLAATPAAAVEEGIFSLAPEAGFAVLTGDLGDLVAPDLVFGASMSYGILDWLAISGTALYGSHQQSDEDKTGELDLDHFFVGLGPRFNYSGRLVVPYVTPLVAMTFLKYKAKWDVPAETLEDTEDAHGFGGALEAGVDFFVHDIFTVGLCGRAGYFSSNLSATHRDARGEEVGAYALLAGTLRMTILF